jgi:phage terminase small subunit
MVAKDNTRKPSPAGVGEDGLTQKQRLFVAAYIGGRNATKAAIEAGYSAKTAKQAGSRLLSDVAIRVAIDGHQAAVVAKVQVDAGITLERTLREIARIAYFDPRRMFDAKGNPLALHELDDDTAAVVAGLDVLEEWVGSGQDRTLVGHVKKWKLADKGAALDKLMKHLDGYNAENKGKAQPLADALAGFVSQIHQAGAGRLQFVPRKP